MKRSRCRPGRFAAGPTAAVLWLGAACLVGAACPGCGGDQGEPRDSVPPAADQREEPSSDVAGDQSRPRRGRPQPADTGSNATESEQEAATPPDRRTPGEFALPPGEIPPETNQDADSPPAGGGLQLPESDIAPPDQAGSEASADDPSSDESATSAPELDLQNASWQSVHQKATSGGKITVVDLWALSCQPCLKEFPGLVELDQQFGESIRCIGFNVDFDGRKTRPPESYEDRITQFLRAVEADFPNYISNTPSLDVFADVGIDSIPAVLIFDQQGELVKKFADTGETVGFTYEEDIAPLVAKLAG